MVNYSQQNNVQDYDENESFLNNEKSSKIKAGSFMINNNLNGKHQ